MMDSSSPAYPIDRDILQNICAQPGECNRAGGGLTIRQKFSESFMAAVLSTFPGESEVDFTVTASYAVKCADALIAELSKSDG